MNLLFAVSIVTAWIGATLLLADRRWFARRGLAERLAPYHLGAAVTARRSGAFSVASMRDVLGPLCADLGGRMSRLLGVTEPLADRLSRVHSPLDVTSFRIRQIGWSVLGFGAAAVAALSGTVPRMVGAVAVLTAPFVVFLAVEQHLATQCARRDRRISLELPVIAEQLGMLLSSGWSLGAALGRLAKRGNGAVAHDLRRVVSRMQQGVTEARALNEWADASRHGAVRRIVSVLALNRETTDLGRLISDEARAMRAESHRSLLAMLDRRSQTVWIPVTVAALVPGVILLALPFVEVMRVFSSR